MAPEFLYASFVGITRTDVALWWHPPAPNGIFKLGSNLVLDCMYGKVVEGWHIRWDSRIDGTTLQIIHELGEWAFLSQSDDPCDFSMPNETIYPAPWVGGHCKLFWY